MGQRKPGKLLSDYRWVYSHDARSDGGKPERKTLRKLLTKNPSQFLAQMGKLEAELAARVPNGQAAAAEPAAPQEEVAVVDAGSERVTELVDKLLTDWETRKQ